MFSLFGVWHCGNVPGLRDGGGLTRVPGAWKGGQKTLPSPLLAVHLFKDSKLLRLEFPSGFMFTSG